MIKKLIANWQTTSAGLTLILGNIIHLIFAVRAQSATENTWTISISAIVGGLGLMFAGDANKSAPVRELEQVKQQIGTVSKAVTTGDTSVLEKSIATANEENKQP
jgi:hypothetical protein